MVERRDAHILFVFICYSFMVGMVAILDDSEVGLTPKYRIQFFHELPPICPGTDLCIQVYADLLNNFETIYSQGASDSCAL